MSSPVVEDILKDYPEYDETLVQLAEQELIKVYERAWLTMAFVNQVGAVLCWMDGYLYAMDLHKTGVT